MASQKARKTLQIQERAYKPFDEQGLFMLVTPTGGRLWRFRYRLGGVEKLLTLGAYPDVTLKRAREKRDDARKLVADGIDPRAKRQAERAAQADTFEAIAQSRSLAPETMEILGTRLKSFLYPYVGTLVRSHPLLLRSCWQLCDVSRHVGRTRLIKHTQLKGAPRGGHYKGARYRGCEEL